jgi:hypothetical protein
MAGKLSVGFKVATLEVHLVERKKKKKKKDE